MLSYHEDTASLSNTANEIVIHIPELSELNENSATYFFTVTLSMLSEASALKAKELLDTLPEQYNFSKIDQENLSVSISLDIFTSVDIVTLIDLLLDLTIISPSLHKKIFNDQSFIQKTELLPYIPPENQKFAYEEHAAIGKKALELLLSPDNPDDYAFNFSAHTDDFGNFLYELEKAKLFNFTGHKITLPNGVQVELGDIVGIGGDFYGVPKEPIAFGKDPAEQQARFLKAYDTFANDKPKAFKRLQEQLNREKKAIHDGLRKGKKPSVVFKEIGNAQNARYTFFTIPGPAPVNVGRSRYSDLAFRNFDHFMGDARTAYAAGHAVALRSARAARESQSYTEKLQKMRDALAQEFFAGHFLTDIFSSGHMRTPRREIYEYLTGKKVSELNGVIEHGISNGGFIASALALAMHNEDNEKGLYVSNAKHGSWKAYGDECYHEQRTDEDADNNKKAQAQPRNALAAGLAEVWEVYAGYPTTNAYLDYLPLVDETRCHPPLLRTMNGCLEMREEEGTYTQVNSATSASFLLAKPRWLNQTTHTVGQFFQKHLFRNSPTENREVLEADIEAFADVTDAEVGCLIS